MPLAVVAGEFVNVTPLAAAGVIVNAGLLATDVRPEDVAVTT